MVDNVLKALLGCCWMDNEVETYQDRGTGCCCKMDTTCLQLAR